VVLPHSEVVDGGWGRTDETLTLEKLGLKK
jgi:hypothetical protein